VANKMADKKKNSSQSQTAEPKASSDSGEKEQGMSVKAITRERGKREVQETKVVKQQSSKGSSGSSRNAPGRLTRLRNGRAARFVFDAYYELRHKVTWPTFAQARNMTIVVILLSVAVGLALWIIDLGLYQLFLLLSKLGGGG
jgi:preprotein translocase SecE subunit